MTTTAELYCPHCAYDLRGLTSRRCPECGTEFDPATLAVSRIPWVHRRQIGRVRAYLRTLWMVLRHPLRFGGEVVRPVSLADARRFREVSLTLLCLTLLGTLACFAKWWWDSTYFTTVPVRVSWMRPTYGSPLDHLPVGWFTLLDIPTMPLVATVAAWLGARLMLPCYAAFFGAAHLTSEQRARARMMSMYVSAVLVPLPALSGMACGMFWIANALDAWSLPP